MKGSVKGLCVAAAVLFLGTAVVDAQNYRLSITGAGPASLGYTLAAGLAENTNTKSKVVRMTAETSGGYVENIRLVGRGESEFGLTGGTQIFEGLRAIGPYEGEQKYENLRGVAVAYEGNISWNAREGIEKVEDLVGKRVSLGPPGSNISYVGELILQVYGIKDKVEILRLSYEESSRAFVDGTIDAFMGGPAPYPAVMQAAAQKKINILPLDREHIAKIAEISPFVVGKVPASAYDWLDKDVMTVGYLVYIITNKDVPEDAVYEFLKANLSEEGVAYLKKNHRIWNVWETPAYITRDRAFALEGIKLHPGAVKFWKEKGVDLPADILP